MKIIILGAGQVGSSVAESLVSEANDITMVDVNHERLSILQDRLDLPNYILQMSAGPISGKKTFMRPFLTIKTGKEGLERPAIR